MMGLRMWRLLLAAIGASMLVAAPAQAQFDRLVDALKDKAVDAITQPNQAQPASDEPQAKRARLTIDQGFDFTPGTHVVTAIDFGDSAVGSMPPAWKTNGRSEEHTSELQSLMRISYAVFCLTKKIYKAQTDACS